MFKMSTIKTCLNKNEETEETKGIKHNFFFMADIFFLKTFLFVIPKPDSILSLFMNITVSKYNCEKNLTPRNVKR